MEALTLAFNHPAASFVLGLFMAFALMEPLAAWLHRRIFHGPLWFIHRTHHPDPGKPRAGGLEHNDVFGLVFATLATGLFIASPALLHWESGAATGVTLYGLIYGIIHDGFIHERGPTSPWFAAIRGRISGGPKGPFSRWLYRIRGAHLLHHQGRCRDVRTGRSPYGLLAPVSRPDSGFSLVELMVVMALVGIAALGLSRVMVNHARNQRIQNARNNLQQVRSLIQETVKDPVSLEKSSEAAVGSAVYHCLNVTVPSGGITLNDPSSWPRRCQGGTDLAFDLLSRSGRPISGFYNEEGIRCTDAKTASAQCPFAVSATLVAECPPPLTGLTTTDGKCAEPRSVAVKWFIQHLVQAPGVLQMKPIVANDLPGNLPTIPIQFDAIRSAQDRALYCPSTPQKPSIYAGRDDKGGRVCQSP